MTTTYYPVPPVCHLWWTPRDWERAAVHVEEPDTINSSFGIWTWTGERDAAGQRLYRLNPEAEQ